jgi:ABC-type polysaccharide/polyol phosphate transport system ATPase subunit
MGELTIELCGVGKYYRLGERAAAYGTLRDAIAARVRRANAPVVRKRDLWALRDIDLSVNAGDVLGVIGRNGAGKTTLLKVLARIIEPTTGVSRTRGAVGALLDVGTGFHPELTGRENVFFNGVILGMTRREVAARLEQIVEFSGLGRLLNTPLKRYSSGMQLRLAFAVAAHLRPDIVLVDELLAVGDAEFQRKCLGKMDELSTEGRTVVFVSRDMSAIRRLCTRGVWLEEGRVAYDGQTAEAIERYLREGAPRTFRAIVGGGDGPVGVAWMQVRGYSANGDEATRRDLPLELSARLEIREPVPGLDVAFFLLSE